MNAPRLYPTETRDWAALGAEQRREALAAALAPFAGAGSVKLAEAAAALLIRVFAAGLRPAPKPATPAAPPRHLAFCRRTARRALDGGVSDPFPRALFVRPSEAPAPKGCRLAGEIAGWAFYDAKEETA